MLYQEKFILHDVSKFKSEYLARLKHAIDCMNQTGQYHSIA